MTSPGTQSRITSSPRTTEAGVHRPDFEGEIWCNGWNSDNSRVIYGRKIGSGSTTYKIDPPVPDTDNNVAGFSASANRYGSAYPNVGVAAYGDGSTPALSYDADPDMLRHFTNRDAGRELDTSRLKNFGIGTGQI